MQFWLTFLIGLVHAYFFLHLVWKARHSIAKSLIFPNMKTTCSYAKWFTYNSGLKFDYLFFYTLYIYIYIYNILAIPVIRSFIWINYYYYYLKLICNKRIRVEQTNYKIYSYGSLRPLLLNGVITTNISTDLKHCSAQFHVLDGNSWNLLSTQPLANSTCWKLGSKAPPITHHQLISIPQNSNASSNLWHWIGSCTLILMFPQITTPLANPMSDLMSRKSSNGFKN
jgi:hypothetical protein